MNFQLLPMLLAGAIAAIIMVIVRMGIKGMGVPLKMDVLSMLGSKMGATGTKTRIVGMLTHM